MRLELSEQMLSVISNALSDAPYRFAAPVLAELQRQIEQQTRPAAPPQPAPPPPIEEAA